MPPECLERIVSYAAQDHRVLSTLMRVNSTLFRLVIPYLYREPFRFMFGDEFQLDWDTESWTRYLREVRHAKLLLLYLCCTDTVQALMTTRGGEIASTSSLSLLSDTSAGPVPPISLTSTTASSTITLTTLTNQNNRKHSLKRWHRTSTGLVDARLDLENSSSLQTPLLFTRIPQLLKRLLAPQLSKKSLAPTAATAFHTVNYLDYVEHLDLDSFLDSAFQTLFSGLPAPSGLSPQTQYWIRKSDGSCLIHERTFVERVLFLSTAKHITSLSISVVTFARLQRDLMEHLLDHNSQESTAAAPVASKNSAGIMKGASLSQLARLNISGLHAELKPKVLRAIRWFVRRHVARYPGVLRAISFEGPGDSSVNRRRVRNRNVIHVEPVQPGVVHFSNQDIENENGVDEVQEDEAAQADDPPNNVLVVDETGQINNIIENTGAAMPADFHSQYYLLAHNPDESNIVDFMCILRELKGQLEELDLSRWSWGVISQHALDLIPTEHLITLRFHSRSRIQSVSGRAFMKSLSKLSALNIHAFDANMLNWNDDISDPLAPPIQLEATIPSSHPLLTELSLTGSVPNVLPVIRDAIQHTGKTLASIDLTAYLDGFLSAQETQQLLDWSTYLSNSMVPHLTILRLHGHLALSFDAPLLSEMCPTLRRFGLTIKSYTSSSFVRSELARVLPRFMTPWVRNKVEEQWATVRTTRKFSLHMLELEGPWILTERDVDQIADQISGLVVLNLAGCRFHPSTAGYADEYGDDRQQQDTIPVVRLAERLQDTLRVLHIHRRGLEREPHRYSGDFSTPIRSVKDCHQSYATKPTEPVLAFKRRFPKVKLVIQEKQHENSFVLAPSRETLRRIQRPLPRARIPSVYSESLGQPPVLPPRQRERSTQSASWWRATNAVPFLRSLRRSKTYSNHGLESDRGDRFWRRGESGRWRRDQPPLSFSSIASRLFGGGRSATL
ncbi:hypothetical protein BGZ51_004863 [Haplosporangium sp. Z 767]|nr:hypothetical protein BGZ50_006712 [Haplosporangium sp. Z 11]KAF9182217.1 hypothetical protein BGZ51_004863 [Haplosporangium sp. Z 767]